MSIENQAAKKPVKTKRVESLSPAQRSAIVIAMLGEEAAKPIVEQLDDVELAHIASGLEALALLGKDELSQVVVDFLSHLRNTSGGFVSGKATAKDIVANVINFRRQPDQSTEVDPFKTADDNLKDSGDVRETWKEVEKFPVEKIADYLNRLTPNLVAIVLNRLSVTVSSEVFNYLEDDKLKLVMKHMVEAQELDPRLENVVTRMIEMEFLNTQQGASEVNTEHLAGIGEMLSLIPSEKREPLVQFLESDYASALSEIQGALFTIDSLPEILPRSAVPVVFRGMDMGEMVDLFATLQGVQSEVFDFLIGNISSRLADQLKDKLSDHPALSPEDVDISQRNFLMRIMDLKRNGEIVL